MYILSDTTERLSPWYGYISDVTVLAIAYASIRANKWDYFVVSDYFTLEDIREDIFDMFVCYFIIENKTVSH